MKLKYIASLLAFIIFIILALGSEEKTPEEKCADTTMAFVMSQDFVKRRLKSPSSAEFPYATSEGVNVIYLGDCKHKVYAYVDAVNSFGAKLRSKYYVELQNEKGTDEWKLLDLKLEE